MENISVKGKEFEIIEQKGEHTYLVRRKGTTFFLRKFDNSGDFNHYVDSLKALKGSGIPIPKIIRLDKKELLLVSEFIRGLNIFDVVYEGRMDEKIYEKMFTNSYLARIDKISLDWNPENWIYTGERIYYISTFFEKVTDDNVFVKHGIYQWFYTKEFEETLKKKGLPLKPNLRKEDFVINKEIVLMTVKYYH